MPRSDHRAVTDASPSPRLNRPTASEPSWESLAQTSSGPILGHSAAGFAERVLIDVDHLVVAEQAQGELVEPGDVAAEDQGGGQQAPERDVGVLLVGRKRRGYRLALPVAQVAQEQVVGVVPAPGTAEPVQLLRSIKVEAVAEESRGNALE